MEARKLAPVTFFPVPAAVFMMPAAIDPDGVRVRRPNPFARYPYVSVAVPLIIAGTPVPTVMGTRTAMLDADVWRLDLDIDVLREGRRDGGETEEGGCRDEKQFFLHTSGFFLSRKSVHRWRREPGCCRTADGTRQGSTGCAENLLTNGGG